MMQEATFTLYLTATMLNERENKKKRTIYKKKEADCTIFRSIKKKAR
jgi:hypothetical protein